MPICYSKEIKSYSVKFFSKPYISSSQVSRDPNKGFLAEIKCKFDSSSSQRLYLRFYEAGFERPDDDKNFSDNEAIINYPISILPAILDTLREEKPVYLYKLDYRGQYGLSIDHFYIESHFNEPVGENEN